MATINPRTKGAGAEREIADALNFLVFCAMKEYGDPNPIINSIQRNQQQTAVGGADLTGTFGLAIEVKRQETLSIPAWWRQCVKSAERNDEVPILIYRQNRQAWNVVMNVEIPVDAANTDLTHKVRAEISFDDFKAYFKNRVLIALRTGHKVKI